MCGFSYLCWDFSQRMVLCACMCIRKGENRTYLPNLQGPLHTLQMNLLHFSLMGTTPAGRTADSSPHSKHLLRSCLCCAQQIKSCNRIWGMGVLEKYIEQNSVYLLESITHSVGSSQLSVIVLFTLAGPKMTPISKGSYFTFISFGHLK